MAEELDYVALYALQDRVLDIIKELENDFYLTGGTALHRFYYDARYSNDLDLFVANGINFSEDVAEVIQTLEKSGLRVAKVVRSRDFYRIFVNDTLQVDFVNDRVYRYKKSIIINGYKIDNKLNILTNKICAIISRDEEKDIFDLFCLSFNEDFNWKEILKIANKKAVVEKDILIYRLQSFPLSWLSRIKKLKDIGITKEYIDKICDDIINGKSNSLRKFDKLIMEN